MEGEGAASVAVHMEYTESPAIVERLTNSAPVDLDRVQIQESNIVLTSLQGEALTLHALPLQKHQP